MKFLRLITKPSAILLAVTLALGIATTVFASGDNQARMHTDSSYMKSTNLVLSSHSDKRTAKMTDGDAKSCFTNFGKSPFFVTIDLKSVQEFNSIIIKEKGLNVQKFKISVSEDNESYKEIFKSDKIEYHRLCTFDAVSARYIRFMIEETDASVKIKEFEVYNEPNREKGDFRVTAYISAGDVNSILEDTATTVETKTQLLTKYFDKYNLKNLDNIFFYCGVAFDQNGNVFLGSKDGQVQYAEEMLKMLLSFIRERCKEGVKFSFVIPNCLDYAGMNEAMGNNQKKMADNLIAFANKFGFEGIDIDYEFPQSDKDFQVYSDFLVALKNAMNTDMHNKTDSLLSCAFGTRDLKYTPEAIEAIDMVNVMTYDIMDQDGQHSNFWSCAVQGGEYLLSEGFKKEQLNIGMPFYGTQNTALMEQYIYKDASGYDYFDNTYTFSSYYDQSSTEAYFNSPAMIRDKSAHTFLKGYGGLMVWSYTCDTEYASKFSLWRAVDDGLSQFGGV